MRTTDINGVAEAISDELNKYSDEVIKTVKNETKKAATNCAKKIREKGGQFGSNYASSWKSKKTDEGITSIEYTVHSKDHYSVAHLLEYGHAAIKGQFIPKLMKRVTISRNEGKAHIRPAYEETEKEYISNLERELRS